MWSEHQWDTCLMVCVPLFCSYHILTSSVIYYWIDAWQHRIYLLNSTGFSIRIGVAGEYYKVTGGLSWKLRQSSLRKQAKFSQRILCSSRRILWSPMPHEHPNSVSCSHINDILFCLRENETWESDIELVDKGPIFKHPSPEQFHDKGLQLIMSALWSFHPYQLISWQNFAFYCHMNLVLMAWFL